MPNRAHWQPEVQLTASSPAAHYTGVIHVHSPSDSSTVVFPGQEQARPPSTASHIPATRQTKTAFKTAARSIGHRAAVKGLEFRDTTTLVSTSDDCTTRFWDVESGSGKLRTGAVISAPYAHRLVDASSWHRLVSSSHRPANSWLRLVAAPWSQQLAVRTPGPYAEQCASTREHAS